MFSYLVNKHLVWKCRKEFDVRRTRVHGWQDFNAKTPKRKDKQNKRKVLHFLLRAVPKAGSRKGLWNGCQSSTVSGMEARELLGGLEVGEEAAFEL